MLGRNRFNSLKNYKEIDIYLRFEKNTASKKVNIVLKRTGYTQNKERIWDMIELKFHEMEYFCCCFGLILLLGSYILDCFCYFIYL